MADNIDVTPGTGKTVATTDIGGAQFQNVIVTDDAGAPVDFSAAVPVTQGTSPWIVAGGGTAGAPGAAVLTIQGVAAGTSVIVGGATADDAAATGNPVQVAGKFTASAPTFADGDTAQLRLTAKGHLIVGGSTADDAAAPAAADTYPVVAGGIYRGTMPTYTDGDRAQLHFGTRGALSVQLISADGATGVTSQGNSTDLATSATARNLQTISYAFALGASQMERVRTIAGTFGSPLGVLAVEQAGSSFGRQTTNTTTTHKSGAGILHKIVVNTKGASANTATVYDNTAGSGTVIAVIDTVNINSQALEYDLAFATGLTIVTATGTPADLTIVYR
jgi:microcompartment protein CcmK/EutM